MSIYDDDAEREAIEADVRDEEAWEREHETSHNHAPLKAMKADDWNMIIIHEQQQKEQHEPENPEVE